METENCEIDDFENSIESNEFEGISLDDCPAEIIMYICIFMELEYLGSLFFVSKSFHAILDRDIFFRQLCGRRNIKMENKPSCKSDKEWFFLNVTPKVMFLYTTNAPCIRELKERYLHHFPYGNFENDVKVFNVYQPKINEAIPTYEDMLEYDVIVEYGGNDIKNREQHSNDLVRILENKDCRVSIVSLAYNNGGGTSVWNFGGRWLHEGWNAIKTSNNIGLGWPRNIDSVEVEDGFEEYFSEEALKNAKEYNGIIMKGEAIENSNVLVNFMTTSKGIEKLFRAHCVVERSDCRLIHLNFVMNPKTVDMVYECIKYVHKRKTTVKKKRKTLRQKTL